MFRTGRQWWNYLWPWSKKAAEPPIAPSSPPPIAFGSQEPTGLWISTAPMGARNNHSLTWHTAPTAEYLPRIMTLGQLTAYRVVRSR